MHRFFRRTCAVAAAGVALGMWAVPAASASGGGGAAIHPRATGPAGFVAPRFTSRNHAIGVGVKATNNRFFAGYAAAVATGSATTVLASFAIPTLTCTTTDRAIAPGTTVAVHRSLSAAFVFVGCVNGMASYFPGLIVNGREKDFTSTPFAAGDVIDLVTKVSTNRTRVQVTDVTTGVTQLKIRAGGSARAAVIGDDGWATSTGKLEHVPDFGKLTFKTCVLDGKTLASWRPHAYQRVNSIGTVQITTGNFWPGGTAFTTHFQHS